MTAMTRTPDSPESIGRTLATVAWRVLYAAAHAAATTLRDEVERIDAEYTAQLVREGRL